MTDTLVARRTRMIPERRFVYVLETVRPPHRHYVGVTSDVCRRLERHNEGTTRHTAKWRPWRLLVAIEFADARLADSFERFLKTGSGRAFARRHF